MIARRINAHCIQHSIESKAITAILGPRRVGKSYFTQEYAKHTPERLWIFLNMDLLEQQERIRAGQLSTLITEAAKQSIGENKLWVVIDEAQKCPELFDQVKFLYDQYKDQEKIKFILTGSAILGLHRLSAESLAGRIDLHYLYEFNLREAVSLTEKRLPLSSLFESLFNIDQLAEHIHQLTPFKPLLEKQLTQQLVWGGLPELLSKNDSNDKIAYLNNYLQTYLEKDVRAIETLTDLNLYRNLLSLLAEQTGSLRDDTRLTTALRCKPDTLKKYRSYIEATLFFTDIFPFIDSTLKRLVKSPKGYLLNNGLVSLLTGLFDISTLQQSGLIGHRLENWFLNELRVWLTRSPLHHTIHFWRTSSGAEVDFIVSRKPAIFPFEITWNTTIDAKKIKNLRTFLAESTAKWGYYVYRGDFAIDQTQRIIFLPCWAIA